MIKRLPLSWYSSFLQTAIIVIALMMNVIFIDYFHSARLGVLLVIFLLFHILTYPRFLFCREFVLYIAFVGYMFFSLLWTPDIKLAMNTLEPATNFAIILILFSALVTYHDLHAVLLGSLSGFLIGTIFFTITEGFPFIIPENFSYNAFAVMYLSALFITLIFGWYIQSRILILFFGFYFLLHIIATGSIKTNIGVLLGVAIASLIYFKHIIRVIIRNAIYIIILISIISYTVISNESLNKSVLAGINRITLGYEVLKVRTDLPGYSGAEERFYWGQKGIEGWAQNPLLGHGVEAFRYNYGITSHSVPIDLLYNSGLIGFVLFYAIFISMAWRLFHARDMRQVALRAIIMGSLVCYLFISLTGAIHYTTFLAIFFSISTALLRQHRRQTYRAGVCSMEANA